MTNKNSIARILIADSFKQSHGKNHITAPNIARHSHTRVAEITVENVQDIDLLKQVILNTSFDLVDFYGIVNFLKTEINIFGKVQEIIPNMVIDKFPAIKTDTMQSYLQNTLSGSKSQPECFFCEPTIQIRLYSQAYSGTPNQVDSVLFAVCEQDFQQKSFDKNSPGLLGADLEMETHPNKINFFETVKRLVNDLESATLEFGYNLAELFSQSGINSTRLKI